MNSKTILLLIASILIFIGLVKPNISLPINTPVHNSVVVVTPPQDKDLRDKCLLLIDVISSSSSSDKKKDAMRLSDLFMDLATLIELDGENEVIKTTEEIRQANSLSGQMLRMNIQGKYPGLKDAAEAIIISQVGNDVVPLDTELRKKSVDAFRALAWACVEGAK